MTLMIFHRVLIACAILFLLAYGTFELVSDSQPTDRADLVGTPAEDLPVDLERDRTEQGAGALFTGLGMIGGGLVLSAYFVWLIRQPLPPRDEPAVA